MYRITFILEQKTYTLRAKDVAYDYPMVTVRNIIWSSGSPLILAPEEQTRKRFEDASELIIPFHSIQLIEEISERKPQIREIAERPEKADNGHPTKKPPVRELLLRNPPPSGPYPNSPNDNPKK